MAGGSQSAAITALFDYDSLDATQRSIIQQRTGEIRERLRRSAQDVWEIGQKLSDVRSRLKYGQFLTWLKVEFGWSQRTAYNFINVYETFGDRFANLAKVDIATSLLYQLASPSVPEDLREQVLRSAEQGQKITAKALRSKIKQRKQLKSAAVDEPQEPAGPEIITVIPQSVESIASVETDKATERFPAAAFADSSAPAPVAVPLATPAVPTIKPGWYQLDQQHLIYCGDTASAAFIERLPAAKLAIAVTANDWAHDWLIDQIDNIVVLPQAEFTTDKLKQLLLLLSNPRDSVVFPWLPQSDMLAVAHQLGRRVYGGDADIARCQRAISAAGLAAARIEAEVVAEVG
ncbi:MAG: DUF3102 domain-containing protein [Leptolyngbya sp. SIO4C1]|nr:DUF3102 domain-containing protein [Leptolyngbya sp. SIO4C1]